MLKGIILHCHSRLRGNDKKQCFSASLSFEDLKLSLPQCFVS